MEKKEEMKNSIKKRVINKKHPVATTCLDRPSSFYNRSLNKEFRAKFIFDYHIESSKSNDIEKEKKLIKKR